MHETRRHTTAHATPSRGCDFYPDNRFSWPAIPRTFLSLPPTFAACVDVDGGVASTSITLFARSRRIIGDCLA